MLQTELSGNILHIQLARPPVNALNPELLRNLRDAIDSAPGTGARGIVLAGAPGIFSAGLDVPALLSLDRPALREAWLDFFGICASLAKSTLPSVAAITGHAPAGGAVLSLFCDYRVMARGPFKIGLNETQVGLIVPESIQIALRRIVGTYRAERLLVAGEMVEADRALEIGLVDELTDVDHVVRRAEAWLQDLLKLPSRALGHTRAIARADLVDAVGDPERLKLDYFLDEWFGEETQSVLHNLVAALKARKSPPG